MTTVRQPRSSLAVAAVLPPGVADGDPRRAPAEALLDEGTDEAVLFRGLQGPT